MKRDSQNSEDLNELPPVEGGTTPEDQDEPSKISYYYDDATGYEIYSDVEDEDESGEQTE